MSLKQIAKNILPGPLLLLYRSVRDKRDIASILRFLASRHVSIDLDERVDLVERYGSTFHTGSDKDDVLRFLASGPSVNSMPFSSRLELIESFTESQYKRDVGSVLQFLDGDTSVLPFADRLDLIKSFHNITQHVKCWHKEEEVLEYVNSILSVPKEIPGCFVEAGSFKGGSTCKFSLAVRAVDRRLIVFDSFEGIPEHNEAHDKNIYGNPAYFTKGSYLGSLEEVKANVLEYGSIESCEFVKGWFEDTLPKFSAPIAGIYLDVDLAQSTRTCLKFLYPHLQVGGSLYSQDGHLPLVIEVFDDDEFWEKELGVPKPKIEGLGKSKLIRIIKTC